MTPEPFKHSTHLPHNDRAGLTVKATQARVTGWANIAFFTFCTVGSYLSGQSSIAPFFLIFVAVGVVIILTAGDFTIDSEGITYKTGMARYRMAWAEVAKIEIDLQRTTLLFSSADGQKRLSTIGPAYWSGPDKAAFAQFFEAELKKRGLFLRHSQKPLTTLPKGTKVRS